MSKPPLTSHEDYVAAGYVRSDDGVCRSETCRAPIVWYVTPTNKKIPVDADGKNNHFATCADATRFRKKKGAA